MVAVTACVSQGVVIARAAAIHFQIGKARLLAFNDVAQRLIV
jgi:hypothetical protein